MKVETPIKTLEISDIACDKCGQSAKKADSLGLSGLEFATFKASWGYLSGNDGLVQEAHLCEGCSEIIVKLMRNNGVCVRQNEHIWHGTAVLEWLAKDKKTLNKAVALFNKLLHAECVKAAARYQSRLLAKSLGISQRQLKLWLAKPVDLNTTLEYADALGVEQLSVGASVRKKFEKELKKAGLEDK